MIPDSLYRELFMPQYPLSELDEEDDQAEESPTEVQKITKKNSSGMKVSKKNSSSIKVIKKDSQSNKVSKKDS